MLRQLTDLQVAGAVLVAMFPLLVVGMISIGDLAAYGRAVTAAYPGNLEAIALLGAGWTRAMTTFMGAIVLMSVGLALLTLILYQSGARLSGAAALTLFAIAAVLFLVWLAAEGSLTVWAGDETKRGSPSTAYLGLVSWVEALFISFMQLAYLSIALFGRALLRSGVAKWSGWISLAFGTVGALARSDDLSALGVAPWLPGVPAWILAGVPGWIPLWGLAIGVVLLVKARVGIGGSGSALTI